MKEQEQNQKNILYVVVNTIIAIILMLVTISFTRHMLFFVFLASQIFHILFAMLFAESLSNKLFNYFNQFKTYINDKIN